MIVLSLKKLREQVSIDDKENKRKEFDQGPKASAGYGGKFGVQKDRMDKVGGWPYWGTLFNSHLFS